MNPILSFLFPKVACNECSVKMKKCLLCGESIIEKVIKIFCYQKKNLSFY